MILIGKHNPYALYITYIMNEFFGQSIGLIVLDFLLIV